MMGVPLQGVTLGEQLAYQNIVSRRATFHYNKLGEHLESFLSDVVSCGGTPKGACFYSLNNVPMDETTDMEFFVPLRQSFLDTDAGLLFHSYFEVSPLAQTVITGEIEQRTEYAYAQLLDTLQTRNLEINTPFFHTFPDDGAPYVSVYLGYTHPTTTST